MKPPVFSQKQIYEFIKEHEPFCHMSDACLLKIASVLETESYPAKSLLIKKGDKLNELYILMKGRLYYQITDAQGDVTYKGEFNEGAIIGEMALLSDLERSADVYTLRDSILLRLSKKDFLGLSQTYPELLNKITQIAFKRLTNSLQGINPPNTRGILNNIPVDIMRRYSGNSKIIASNVTVNSMFKLTPLPHSLSGWKLLYNKIMGKEEILPLNFGELVFRLLTIASHQSTEKMLALADNSVSLN